MAHIVFGVSVLGADAALLALASAGLAGAAPQSVYPAMHLLVTVLLVPLALGAVVTGLIQVVVGRWHPLRHWWVLVKLLATGAGTGLAAFVLSPGLAKAAEAATGATAFLTPERQRAYAVILAVQCVVLVGLAALGVVKPGSRKTARST